MRASDFSISSMRNIFSERDNSRPNALVAALFPHLNTHPHLMPLSLAPFNFRSFTLQPPSIPTVSDFSSAARAIRSYISDFLHSCHTFFSLPYELTLQECDLRRQDLEKIRDERATALGELVGRRDELIEALETRTATTKAHIVFLQRIDEIIIGRHSDEMATDSSLSLLTSLSTTASETLPRHSSLHHDHLHSHSLVRPSRLTLIWPRLLIVPPLTLFVARELYASRDTLVSTVQDAWETIKGFWRSWLVEPIKEILKTVRTGGDEGVIVQKESIAADMKVSQLFLLALPCSVV